MNKQSTYGWDVGDPKLWRTMVSFLCRSDNLWYVILPGWCRHVAIGVPHDDLPSFIQDKVEPGFCCYARVNTQEEDALKLIFEGWEQGMLCVMCQRGVFSSVPGGDFMELKCDTCECKV